MPETWGLLPKSQVDDETIEEAIARLILEHNEDETAHLGTGQSLQSHKASEIIDHVIASIVADKIKDFEVGREKLTLDKLYLRPNFESLDAWTITGSGGVNLYLGGADIYTPYGSIGTETMKSASDILDIEWETKDAAAEFVFYAWPRTNVKIYFAIGYPETDSIGFKLEDEKLYAFWFTDEVEYTSEITGINLSKRHTYRWVLKHGEKIDFYVDEVLKYTTTEHIPVPPEILSLFVFLVTNKTTAQRSMTISGAMYLQDR